MSNNALLLGIVKPSFKGFWYVLYSPGPGNISLYSENPEGGFAV